MKTIEPTETIGLVGAGVMGLAAASALRDQGWRTLIFEAFPGARDRAAGQGFTLAPDIAALAGAVRVALLFLPGPREVAQVVAGPGGFLEKAAAGSVIVDLSTSSPTASREMSRSGAVRGCFFLDAPVLGRPDTVGRWTLPVGGDEAALEAVRPVLSALAGVIQPLGESGLGHTAKLLNQLMFGAINAMTAEMMALADRLGLKPALLYDLISGSRAATVSGLFLELGRRISEERYQDPTFTLDLLQKDTRLALDMARDVGAPVVLGRMVEYLNECGRGQGLGNRDTSVLWRAVAGMWSLKSDPAAGSGGGPG